MIARAVDRAWGVLLSLQLVLGSLSILDATDFDYYVFIHRVIAIQRFSLDVDLSIPMAVLLATWVGGILRERDLKMMAPLVASLPFLALGMEPALGVASLICVAVGLWRTREHEGLLLGLLSASSVLNLLALLHWLVAVPLRIEGSLEWYSSLERDLYYVGVNLAPLLVLPLLFMWVLRATLDWGLELRDRWTLEYRGRDTCATVLLAGALVISVASAVYPYSGAVNPNQARVGVDVPHYFEAAESIRNGSNTIFTVAGGSRPLFYASLFAFKGLTGLSLIDAVRFYPVLLNPVLVLSVFYLAHRIHGGTGFAAWAAFFTATGFQTTVGMYSYFLTNNLGLILIFLSLGSHLRAMEDDSYPWTLLSSILGSMLVFTHPWTLDQYLPAILVAAALPLLENHGGDRERFLLRSMAIYLGVIGSAEAVKHVLLSKVGGIKALSTAGSLLSTPGEFWYTSIFSFRVLYGGLLSNLLLISLALIGTYHFKGDKPKDRYINWLIAISSLAFLLLNETGKSRILYNLPIGIVAATGMQRTMDAIDEPWLEKVWILFVVTGSTVYVFRSLANMV